MIIMDKTLPPVALVEAWIFIQNSFHEESYIVNIGLIWQSKSALAVLKLLRCMLMKKNPKKKN